MTEEIGIIEDSSPTDAASNEPHETRVSDHTKMRTLVAFALKFLQENPQRPLVLHTLPLQKEEVQVPAKVVNNAETQPEPASGHITDIHVDEEPPKKKRKLATPTANTTKLVSVVEIIRREYGKWALQRKGPDGRLAPEALRTGLHQYNELSTLEALGLVNPSEFEQNEEEKLRQVLAGKNFLRQKYTAHLKVTLSVSALPDLEKKGATYEPPPPIVKSRSAKARERKRIRNQAKKVDGALQVPE